MILEILFLLATLFLIVVAFYRQRREDLQILQLEESQVDTQLAELLDEQQAVVIRGVTPPKGLTREALQKITRLQTFPVGGQSLSSILATPELLASAQGLPTLSLEDRRALASELSIPIWANHTWKERLAAARITGSAIGTLQAEAVLGGLGMFRTTAYYTLLMPTEGKYIVHLVMKQSEDFLPPNWEYRYISDLTTNDTPLVADLRYMTIKLGTGNALCLPPHWIICLEPASPRDFNALTIIEYHEPVSMLSKQLQQN